MVTVKRIGHIKLSIYPADHAPPHFHVGVAEYAASISISSLEITAGYLPRGIYELVRGWASENREQLLEVWVRLND